MIWKRLFRACVLMLAGCFAGTTFSLAHGDPDSRFFKLSYTSELAVTVFEGDGRMTVAGEPGDAEIPATWWTAVDLDADEWTTWVDMPVTAAVQTVRVANLKPPPGMALVPDGSFIMGDSFLESDFAERPAHRVYVSAFFMDRHEVSKALWDEVRIWAVFRGYAFDNDGGGKGPDHPVHSISWHDAVKWSNARSEKEGLTPCYTVNGDVYKTGVHEPDCDWTAGGYRLPTEAEWEKAARGGAVGRRYPWRATDGIAHAQANYFSWWTNGVPRYVFDVSATDGFHPDFRAGSPPFTSPVGSFAANAYGLYDMAGNVAEWCWDWYDPIAYAAASRHNPRGPVTGEFRVFRGGGWNNTPLFCRVADRGLEYNPDDPLSNVDWNRGFRTVRNAP